MVVTAALSQVFFVVKLLLYAKHDQWLSEIVDL